MDDHRFEPQAEEFRRVEVITGVGRRRRWTAEAKARIVAESLAGAMSVSEVARRHGLRAQQLFGWRREARAGRLSRPRNEAIAFVPLVAGACVSDDAPPGSAPGVPIEIAMGGIVVRVRGRVDVAALADVLAAVKNLT